jgi:hypothetical protein
MARQARKSHLSTIQQRIEVVGADRECRGDRLHRGTPSGPVPLVAFRPVMTYPTGLLRVEDAENVRLLVDNFVPKFNAPWRP